ncbi:kinase [Bordetella bronchiseptica]|uniref:type II toxin-antitoxin system HipA family toxin n=1 Tax=Bordetella bronchiseptica TaxID=518 RepID=UPI000D7E2A2A|nr:HipA domain-containing protein [Bordetella bronchiseptica]AWP59346.1 kinase [Bordetella bronchiseptica]
MADVSSLIVRLYGEPIGTLTHVGGERTLFAFNEAYIHDPSRPMLSLSFKDAFGQLLTDFSPTRMKLLPFFSNLLPEGHLRQYLADTAHVHPEREYFLLWALGQDLPGAITVTNEDHQAWPNNAHANSDDEAAPTAIEHALRFSLAGVQLKFSAVMSASGGLTIPSRGIGGHWIVKLPSRDFRQVPENEFSMMSLAKMVGIDVPAIDLIDVSSIGNLPEGINHLGDKAFIIERFDRTDDGQSVHIEDFAQVFGVYPHAKYEKASYRSMARVIAAESGDADIAEFIRRATFNVLIGNGDMHLKNWSLIYRDRQRAELSPAYDFVSTIAYLPNEQAALAVSRSKAFSDYTVDELTHLAAKAALPRQLVLDTAQETVALFMQRWASEKNHLPMDKDVRTAIDKHLETLPITAA